MSILTEVSFCFYLKNPILFLPFCTSCRLVAKYYLTLYFLYIFISNKRMKFKKKSQKVSKINSYFSVHQSKCDTNWNAVNGLCSLLHFPVALNYSVAFNASDYFIRNQLSFQSWNIKSDFWQNVCDMEPSLVSLQAFIFMNNFDIIHRTIPYKWHWSRMHRFACFYANEIFTRFCFLSPSFYFLTVNR